MHIGLCPLEYDAGWIKSLEGRAGQRLLKEF
jgi:hypothetical protein